MTLDDEIAYDGEGEPPTLIEQLAAQMNRNADHIRAKVQAAGDKVAVLGEIGGRARECERGSLPDDTAHGGDAPLAQWEHDIVAAATANGTLTWRHVLLDAGFAINAQKQWPQLRDALLTLAGECVNWILDGDRRDQ